MGANAGLCLLGLPNTATGTSSSTYALDSSGIVVAAICYAQAGGTISKVGFYVTAKNGSGTTWISGIEGLTNGDPDGTIKGGGSPASVSFTQADVVVGWNWLTLDNTYVVGEGEGIAVTIRHSSGTVDVSNNMTVMASNGNGNNYNMPYRATSTDSGSTWTTSNDIASIGYQFNDGSLPIGAHGLYSLAFQSFGSSGPWGVRFTSPFTADIIGMQVLLSASGGKTLTLSVYDTSDTLLAQSTMDTDDFEDISPRVIILGFDPVTLTAGVDYRLVLNCDGTATTVLMTYGHADLREAYTGPCYATNGGPGSWTDNTTQALQLNPIFRNIQTSGGGGGWGFRRVPNVIN